MQQHCTSPSGIRLHSYWRSSAAYRVRIALGLLELDYAQTTWKMIEGEHKSQAYQALASFGLVPMLEIDGLKLQQSLAIIEYLQERHADRPVLLPAQPAQRAKARALAQLIACEVHPLNNLRTLHQLRSRFGAGDAQVREWYQHWCHEGLGTVEAMLGKEERTAFALGEQPGLVECFLIPQIYNARRFGVDMQRYPHLHAIEQACAALPAFERAKPENQPDAVAAAH